MVALPELETRFFLSRTLLIIVVEVVECKKYSKGGLTLIYILVYKINLVLWFNYHGIG